MGSPYSCYTGRAAHGKGRAGLPLEVLVELGRRGGERGCSLVVGGVLGQGGALDAPVQEAGDDAAPDENCETKSGQDRAHGDEYRTVWEGRMVHEGRIASRRDGGSGILWDVGVDRPGEGGEARKLGGRIGWLRLFGGRPDTRKSCKRIW